MAHAGMRQIGAAGDLRVVRVLSLEIRGFCPPSRPSNTGYPGARDCGASNDAPLRLLRLPDGAVEIPV